MSSIRRQVSSRQNGALSRGPVTEEGKRRSSLNALRHGLLATHTVNALEPQENFDVILEDHMQGLGPQDGVHLGLIADMANSQWRMRRLDAYLSLADSRKYNNLNLYEGRLHRRYFRALNAFLAIARPEPHEPESKKEPNEPN